MKRISRALLLTCFGLLLLGGTNAYAGNNGRNNQNNQGNNNQNQNNQGNNNQGNNGGGLLNWIDNLINDIFDNSNNQNNNNQNNNNQNNNNQNNNNSGTWTTGGGGGTAPIDGGLGLLLVAGIGLGIRKATGRRNGA